MGAVVGTVWSLLVSAAGTAVSATAPFGAAGHGAQYLAGHVLLGLGLGQLAAILLRIAVRRIVRRAGARIQPQQAQPAVVTALPARPASVVPLRGRHAA